MKVTSYKEVRIKLALGSLFHDIGKVIWRTGEGEYSKYLSQISKETKYKDEFKYTHAYLTHLFFKKENINDPIIKASAYHHSPFTAPEEMKLFAKIYQLADFHSSVERSKEERKKEEAHLRSIFQNIFQDKAKDEYAYSLEPLFLDEETIFPKKIDDLSLDETTYSSLWKDFKDEFEKIKSEFKASSEKILSKVYYLIY